MSKNCQTGKYTIFYDEFKCGFQPDTPCSDYQYFSAPLGENQLLTADDAAGGVKASCQCLQINSSPFTFSDPSGLDHVKYLAQQKNPYIAPEEGEIVYEGVISGIQTGLTGIPPAIVAATGSSLDGVNDVNSDVRVAGVIFNAVDNDTLLDFAFLLSNEDIYASYGRLPFNRTEWSGTGATGDNYNAFTNLIPVGKRNELDPANDFVKLAIAYNKKCNYVRFIVNDEEKFRVNRLGLPLQHKFRVIDYDQPDQLPANAPLLRPRTLQYGFGTISLFDAYNPQNPGQVNNIGLVDLTVGGTLPSVNPVINNPNGNTVIADFISPYPLAGATGTNFGQGANLKVRYVTVYLLAEDQENRVFHDLKCYKKRILFSRCCLNKIEGVNSCDSVLEYKCKGCIKNCDECACVNCNQCGPYLDCPNPGALGCYGKKCKKYCKDKCESDESHKCPPYQPHECIQAYDNPRC